MSIIREKCKDCNKVLPCINQECIVCFYKNRPDLDRDPEPTAAELDVSFPEKVDTRGEG